MLERLPSKHISNSLVERILENPVFQRQRSRKRKVADSYLNGTVEPDIKLEGEHENAGADDKDSITIEPRRTTRAKRQMR